MKKILCILIFTSLFAFTEVDTDVYICNSKSSKKYHFKETCRGLNACKHEIIKISLKEAKEKGLEICGWED